MIVHCKDTTHFVYLFTSLWTLCFVQFEAIMNICICLKVDACFHFSSISRSLIARSYDKNMFTILYSYQQCMKFQFSISLPSLVLSALFVYFSHSSRYLIVILISHSLMTNDVQLNLSPACDVCSVVNCLFKSFPFF